MQLSWDKIQTNALAFAKRWKEEFNEKSEAQSSVRDFLSIFGVDDGNGKNLSLIYYKYIKQMISISEYLYSN